MEFTHDEKLTLYRKTYSILYYDKDEPFSLTYSLDTALSQVYPDLLSRPVKHIAFPELFEKVKWYAPDHTWLNTEQKTKLLEQLKEIILKMSKVETESKSGYTIQQITALGYKIISLTQKGKLHAKFDNVISVFREEKGRWIQIT